MECQPNQGGNLGAHGINYLFMGSCSGVAGLGHAGYGRGLPLWSHQGHQGQSLSTLMLCVHLKLMGTTISQDSQQVSPAINAFTER